MYTLLGYHDKSTEPVIIDQYVTMDGALYLGINSNINYANGFWVRLDISNGEKILVSYLRDGF